MSTRPPDEPTPTEPRPTLLDRLGGEDQLDAVVGALYFQVLNDPRLARFFANVDVDRVVAHQQQFLRLALSGQPSAAGRDLGVAHRRLVADKGLDGSHFDALLEALIATLWAFGYSEALIGDIVGVVETLRSVVLDAQPGDPLARRSS